MSEQDGGAAKGKVRRTAEETPRWRRALLRVRSPWAGAEAGWLALAVAGWLLWLALPDAQRWELAVALVVGAVMAAGMLWVQSAILIEARRKKVAVKAWHGALLLAGLAVVWWLLTSFLDAGQVQDGARATGWNAGLSERMGEVLTEDRLVWAQGMVWSGLRWAVLAALVPLGMEGAATGLRGRWLRRAGAVLGRPLYWIGMVLGGVTAEAATRWILGWYLPGSPAVGTFVLAVVKVGVAFALDAGLVCFALALTGTYLRDAERAGRLGAGSEALAQVVWSGRLRGSR